MPQELSDMKYSTVALVEDGANQEAHVLLYKRNDSVVIEEEEEEVDKAWQPTTSEIEMMDDGDKKRARNANRSKCGECGHMYAKGAGKCPHCGVELTKKSITERIASFLKGSGPEDDMPSEQDMDEFDLDTLEPPDDNQEGRGSMPEEKDVNKGKVSLADEIAELRAQNALMKNALGRAERVAKGLPADEDEEIYKGLPEGAVLVIKQAKKDAQEAREALAKAKETEELAGFVGVAKKFNQLPGDAEKIGGALRDVAKSSPEAYKLLEQLLGAANENLRQTSVFRELGKRNVVDMGGPQSKAQTLAKSLRDADPKLTQEAAIAKAYDLHPEWYDEERNNNFAEGGR